MSDRKHFRNLFIGGALVVLMAFIVNSIVYRSDGISPMEANLADANNNISPLFSARAHRKVIPPGFGLVYARPLRKNLEHGDTLLVMSPAGEIGVFVLDGMVSIAPATGKGDE